MGPISQGTPHVIETKTEPAALLYRRGQSSTAVSLPAVTSSRHDPHDLLDPLTYLAETLDGATHGGGTHGGTAGRDDGGTPAMTSAAQSNACMSIY